MSKFQVNPLKIFEINGQNCPILSSATTATVGNNRTIVTAISGKIIRVMGWKVSQAGAVAGAYFTLRSASGGTVIHNGQMVPVNTYGDSEFLPINEAGYCETTVSQGLYMDVGAGDLYPNIFYIAYIP